MFQKTQMEVVCVIVCTPPTKIIYKPFFPIDSTNNVSGPDQSSSKCLLICCAIDLCSYY